MTALWEEQDFHRLQQNKQYQFTYKNGWAESFIPSERYVTHAEMEKRLDNLFSGMNALVAGLSANIKELKTKNSELQKIIAELENEGWDISPGDDF